MSGHSKWSQIKRQKAVTDAKKSQVFSKITRMITLAARKGENPDMNPDLRAAIEKAREAGLPSDNIERAIKRGSGKSEGTQLENFRFETYGPGGIAIIIEGITDNKNRATAEIKHLLLKNNSKLAEQGSVLWAFKQAKDRPSPSDKGRSFALTWLPKHTVKLNKKDADDLDKLLEELDNRDDVQEIYTNAI